MGPATVPGSDDGEEGKFDGNTQRKDGEGVDKENILGVKVPAIEVKITLMIRPSAWRGKNSPQAFRRILVLPQADEVKPETGMADPIADHQHDQHECQGM